MFKRHPRPQPNHTPAQPNTQQRTISPLTRGLGAISIVLLVMLAILTPPLLASQGFGNWRGANETQTDQSAKQRPAQPAARSVETTPSSEDHPAGSEAQAGARSKSLIPWRAKEGKTWGLSLSQRRAQDFAQRVIEVMDDNPFQLVTTAGAQEVNRGLDAALARAATTALAKHDKAALVVLVLPALPAQPAIEERLRELGVKILYPLTPHGYAVKADAQALLALAADGLIYAVTQCPPELKVDPALAQSLGLPSFKPTQEDAVEREPGKANLQIYDGDDQAAVQVALTDLGVTVEYYDEQIRLFKLRNVSAAAITALAQMPEVAAIEAARVHRTTLDQSVRVINHTAVRNFYSYDHDNNVTLGMIDSGLQLNHEAFMGQSGLGALYVRYWNVAGEGSGVADNPSGHGTHVAGIMLSRWQDYYASPWTLLDLRGVAPRTGDNADRRFRYVRCGKDTGKASSLYNLEQALDLLREDNGALVINNSWGNDSNVGTDSSSIKADQVVWANQQIHVFSAGNDGTAARTINSPGAAKNVLTVGGVDKTKAIYFFPPTPNDGGSGSSEGPTSDGRKKPDIYAPGVFISSADAARLTQPVSLTGTSMAAPHVTAFLGSLLGHYTSFQRRPALAKAIVMATAERLPGLQRHTGLLDSYYTHFATSTTGARWGWRDTDARGYEYTYWDVDNLPSGIKEMRIVLTWIEPAPAVGAARAVLNDVDLFVDYNKDNNSYRGEWSSLSSVDNVEVITLTNPPAGSYRIKAHNYRTAADYRLAYALFYRQ